MAVGGRGKGGRARCREACMALHPDWLSGAVEGSVVEGDKVAARVTWRGTHQCAFMGIPGTGATVEIQAVHIVEFADGRATQWWGTADIFDALTQMGASAALPN